ncbi:MAG: TlyA family RNA methyltransferase [Alphaproteobacteria bacterium]|nr:MAG: TlyA family RNA methyltransferase [Alphaproteobacteria bacterium]
MAQEKANKTRLDQLLTDQGLVESRAKAQALIMAGLVLVDDVPITKSGHMVRDDAAIRIKGQEHPWVSRGGVKLASAIEQFAIDPTGQIIADIGASTGGFTDVVLHHGAAKVYAVDVGHGQLAWSIRSDARVVVMEQTNARYLDSTHIPELLDGVVCDASFISLKIVLPAVLARTHDEAWLCALIKPQFEAGREYVGKGGVVRDAAVHERVCDDIKTWMTDQGWHVVGISESPITGPKGNKEFLLYARRSRFC